MEEPRELGSNKLLHTWYGVECDREGRVVEIKLGNNNLQGATTKNICLFVRLNFRHRKHTCGIETEIMRGAGEIPASIANLTSLIKLSLEHNKLSGTYPEYIQISAP
jgi:hypothetical protein